MSRDELPTKNSSKKTHSGTGGPKSRLELHRRALRENPPGANNGNRRERTTYPRDKKNRRVRRGRGRGSIAEKEGLDRLEALAEANPWLENVLE
eukprot:1322358-Amorphochlora_amoeboformis.AAC.1